MSRIYFLQFERILISWFEQSFESLDCELLFNKLNIFFQENQLRNSFQILTMLNISDLVITILLLLQLVTSGVPPTWSSNTLINAGQYKALNNLPKTIGTYVTVPTDFNTAFSNVPRIVYGLVGYGQNPGITGQYGFMINTITITPSQFTTQYTIYGVGMYIIYFNYFGISYALTEFIAVFRSMDITDQNLLNPSSTSRIMQTVINNEVGQVYDTTHTIRHIGYLSGFVLTKKTDIYLKLSVNSATTYNLEIGTTGQTTITKVCYFRLSYDQTQVMLGYQTIIDIGSLQGANSIQGAFIYNSPIAAFQYRNFLFGWNHIKIAEGQQTQFLFSMVPGSAQFIYGSQNYQYLLSVNFHLVKRSCDASNPYFLITDFSCNSACPNFYYDQTTYNYCQNCHYSCMNCNPSQQSNQCTQCSPSSHRTLSSGSCLCDNGFYDNGFLVCSSCGGNCLTCQGAATNCTSCDNSLFRSLNSNSCPCQNGYYQDNSGVCTLCMSGCTSCYLNVVEKCSTCDSTLFWKLQSDACVCIDGYYLATSGSSCNPCHITCKTCSASGSTSCSSCQATNHRQISSTSCICSNGYLEASTIQASCISCSPQCLTCSGTSTTCQSCNTTIRTMSGTTCVCNAGTFDQGNGKCGSQCGDGILSTQQQCDDQNTINRDGCSSTCIIQDDHSCLQGVINVSLCYYSSQINYKIKNFYKQPFKNSVMIQFAINAPNLNKNSLGNYLSSNVGNRRLLLASDYVALSVQPTKITSLSYDSNTQLITTNVNYYADVNFEDSTLQTYASNSSSQRYFYNTPTAIAYLPQPFNRLATDYYQEGDLLSAQSLYYAYIVIIIIYFIAILFMLALNKGVIAYQIANVLLLAYYSLLPIKKLDLGFVGWTQWGKYIIGFNYNFGGQFSYCEKAYAISLTCNAFSNMNLMIWLCMVLGVLYLTIMIIEKIMIWRQLKNQQLNQLNKQSERASEIPRIKGPASKIIVLPWIVKKLQSIFLELFFLITMIYPTMFTISICFQNQIEFAMSIVSLLFYGIMMVLIWVFWFLTLCFAQEQSVQRQLSFIKILGFQSTPTIKSFKPFYYIVYFVISFINGLILSLLDSYASLAIILVFSLWGLFHIAGLKWSIYTYKIHAYRALFNHICMIIILLFYILSNAVDMGVNIALGSLLLCVLFFVILVNCIITGYTYFTQRRSLNQAEQKKQYLKQTNSDRQAYSSRNPLMAKNQPAKSLNQQISKKQAEKWKKFIKSKNLQLKEIKKQIAIETSRMDKTMIESQEKNKGLRNLANEGEIYNIDL